MSNRYRASKSVAHGTGRAQWWTEPRRLGPEPAAQPQPKAGVEALKAAAVFLAGGIGMLTVILAAMYFAALLSAHIIDPATAILALAFAAGGLIAVYLWLDSGDAR